MAPSVETRTIGAILRKAGGRRHESGWTFALAIATVFAMVQVFGHIHHEMWRDELHCWAVGRNATGLWDILTGERRYDGHPFLWYYLLHLVSRLFRSSAAAPVVGGSLAILGGLLWLRFAPLPRALRILLLASYYIVYEYGVMTRSYTLGVVLTFAFCALYHPFRIRYVLLAVVLALLSATSVYGTVFACALGFFVLASGPRRMRGEDEVDGQDKLTLPASWFAGVVVLVAGLGLTLLTTWPPADDAYAQPALREVTSSVVRGAFLQYWRAMFPYGGLSEWNWLGLDYFLGRTPVADWAPWFGAAWLALVLVALRRSPRLVATYALGTLGMAASQHIIYPGGWRHIGHYFIFSAACVWLYAKQTRCRAPDRLLHGLFAASLAVQGVTGFVALRSDYRRVFSPATQAAGFIRDHHLQDRPIVGDPDDPTSPVAIALDRPFLFAGSGETSDLPLSRSRRTSATAPEVLDQARSLAKAAGGTALIVVTYDLPAATTPGMSTELLYRAGPAIIDDEIIRIYEVRLQGP